MPLLMSSYFGPDEAYHRLFDYCQLYYKRVTIVCNLNFALYMQSGSTAICARGIPRAAPPPPLDLGCQTIHISGDHNLHILWQNRKPNSWIWHASKRSKTIGKIETSMKCYMINVSTPNPIVPNRKFQI